MKRNTNRPTQCATRTPAQRTESAVRISVFPGAFAALPRIIQFVLDFADDIPLKDETRLGLELAAEEAVTNIISHGYRDIKGEIELIASANDGKATLELLDSGVPFDPSKTPRPKLDRLLTDLTPGGFGLLLIRHFTDEMSYERTSDNRNRLTLVVYT